MAREFILHLFQRYDDNYTRLLRGQPRRGLPRRGLPRRGIPRRVRPRRGRPLIFELLVVRFKIKERLSKGFN